MRPFFSALLTYYETQGLVYSLDVCLVQEAGIRNVFIWAQYGSAINWSRAPVKHSGHGAMIGIPPAPAS